MQIASRNQSLESRIRTLRARHAVLEQRVACEAKRPLPNDFTLQKLKRLKLRTKEEIVSMTGVLRAVSAVRVKQAS